MNNDPLHQFTGIKLMVAVAGFLGGVVQLAWNKNLSVIGAVISVLAGTSCAAFGTPLIGWYYNLPIAVENGTAFLLGLLGMLLTGKLYKFASGISAERIFGVFTKNGGSHD